MLSTDSLILAAVADEPLHGCAIIGALGLAGSLARLTASRPIVSGGNLQRNLQLVAEVAASVAGAVASLAGWAAADVGWVRLAVWRMARIVRTAR